MHSSGVVGVKGRKGGKKLDMASSKDCHHCGNRCCHCCCCCCLVIPDTLTDTLVWHCFQFAIPNSSSSGSKSATTTKCITYANAADHTQSIKKEHCRSQIQTGTSISPQSLFNSKMKRQTDKQSERQQVQGRKGKRVEFDSSRKKPPLPPPHSH